MWRPVIWSYFQISCLKLFKKFDLEGQDSKFAEIIYPTIMSVFEHPKSLIQLPSMDFGLWISLNSW